MLRKLVAKNTCKTLKSGNTTPPTGKDGWNRLLYIQAGEYISSIKFKHMLKEMMIKASQHPHSHLTDNLTPPRTENKRKPMSPQVVRQSRKL